MKLLREMQSLLSALPLPCCIRETPGQLFQIPPLFQPLQQICGHLAVASGSTPDRSGHSPDGIGIAAEVSNIVYQLGKTGLTEGKAEEKSGHAGVCGSDTLAQFSCRLFRRHRMLGPEKLFRKSKSPVQSSGLNVKAQSLENILHSIVGADQGCGQGDDQGSVLALRMGMGDCGCSPYRPDQTAFMPGSVKQSDRSCPHGPAVAQRTVGIDCPIGHLPRLTLPDTVQELCRSGPVAP